MFGWLSTSAWRKVASDGAGDRRCCGCKKKYLLTVASIHEGWRKLVDADALGTLVTVGIVGTGAGGSACACTAVRLSVGGDGGDRRRRRGWVGWVWACSWALTGGGRRRRPLLPSPWREEGWLSSKHWSHECKEKNLLAGGVLASIRRACRRGTRQRSSTLGGIKESPLAGQHGAAVVLVTTGNGGCDRHCCWATLEEVVVNTPKC